MTAFPSADATIEAIQKGAVDYIIKEGDYLGRIRRSCGKRSRAAGDEDGGAAVMEVRGEARTTFSSATARRSWRFSDDRPRRRPQEHGAHHRGERHRQGAGRPRDPRAQPAPRPTLVSINCGALTETLLESELFGHVKGAFTGAVSDKKGLFEAADGGTLFLDEIGETTKAVQVKLLRVLQEEKVRRVGDTRDIPVDVRIIAATNHDLAELIREGTFREDLYYRLNVIPIDLPPLRERGEDLPKLVLYFVRKYAPAAAVAASSQARRAESLSGYPWPGNVRELENVVERVDNGGSPGRDHRETLPDFVWAGARRLQTGFRASHRDGSISRQR